MGGGAVRAEHESGNRMLLIHRFMFYLKTRRFFDEDEKTSSFTIYYLLFTIYLVIWTFDYLKTRRQEDKTIVLFTIYYLLFTIYLVVWTFDYLKTRRRDDRINTDYKLNDLNQPKVNRVVLQLH